MNAKNIFKMEMYKNFHDTSWLIIIGCLSLLTLLTSIFGLIFMNITRTQTGSNSSSSGFVLLALFFVLLVLFSLLGIWAFSIIYPYHLFSTDYNNNALGLMIASGVKRTSYYIIKLLATALCTFIAYLAIFLIPILIFVVIYQQAFIEMLTRLVQDNVSIGSVIALILSSALGALAGLITMFFTVIISRGKFWSIFIYLGISFAITMFTSMLSLSISSTLSSAFVYHDFAANSIKVVISLIEILIFGFLGFFMIRKQDL